MNSAWCTISMQQNSSCLYYLPPKRWHFHNAKPIALVAILCYGRVSVNGSSVGSFSSTPQPQRDKIESGAFCTKSTDSVVESLWKHSLPLTHFPQGISPGSASQSLAAALWSSLFILVFRSLSCFLTLLG